MRRAKRRPVAPFDEAVELFDGTEALINGTAALYAGPSNGIATVSGCVRSPEYTVALPAPQVQRPLLVLVLSRGGAFAAARQETAFR